MHPVHFPQNSIRIHLTNVTGAGASQLLESLLPALVESQAAKVTKIYLPDTGPLSRFSSKTKTTIFIKYRRFLPKPLSRFLECTLFSYKFKGSTPILVLGDLPLRVKARQTLFVQTPHLIAPEHFVWKLDEWKYSIARFIFRLNMKRVSTFIVQTDIMKAALIASYPSIRDRVRVIPHPPPRWLLDFVVPQREHKIKNHPLRLIYPAAEYPHKNHSLLAQIDFSESRLWPVEQLVLTIRKTANPAPNIDWIDCVDHLSSAEMIRAYGSVDGLLFLSKKESLGFPLIEAMYLGLPVICPDLPYAKTLCGEQGIYFDPDSVQSLRAAVTQLKKLLSNNWKPDWSEQLKGIPETWEDVASTILDMAINPSLSAD